MEALSQDILNSSPQPFHRREVWLEEPRLGEATLLHPPSIRMLEKTCRSQLKNSDRNKWTMLPVRYSRPAFQATLLTQAYHQELLVLLALHKLPLVAQDLVRKYLGMRRAPVTQDQLHKPLLDGVASFEERYGCGLRIKANRRTHTGEPYEISRFFCPVALSSGSEYEVLATSTRWQR